MAWFGYDQGVFSGVLISKDFIYHFPETKNANISGIVSSCFSVSPYTPGCCRTSANKSQLGAFVGAIFAFMTGDKTGRKLAVAIGLVCNLVGAVLQIAAFHLPMMFVGRIINGFGMGRSVTSTEMASLTVDRYNFQYLSGLSVGMLLATRPW